MSLSNVPVCCGLRVVLVIAPQSSNALTDLVVRRISREAGHHAT